MTWQSSSHTADLPELAVLQTWVHRPQALAKCTISDVFRMGALARPNPEGAVSVGYGSRDVFMLNRFPCRMVEVVGWVAGVDEKEKSQTLYLDDGDGAHVLQVKVNLPLMTVPIATITKPVPAKSTAMPANSSTTHFKSARERKTLRKAAFEEQTQLAQEKTRGNVRKEKEYVRNDIRVGDVVRVRAKVEEWKRGDGWIRQLSVEPGAGGLVERVDPDIQYLHLDQVLSLHQTLYSRPFTLPAIPIQAANVDDSLNSLDSTMPMPSSEIMSEMSVDYDQVKLCKPSRLKSTQLTDRTFRLYLLDHMSQEITRSLDDLVEEGPGAVGMALEILFPEYHSLLSDRVTTLQPRARTPFMDLSPNSSLNDISLDLDPNSTPRQNKRDLKPVSSYKTSSKITAFTIPSILSVPHLEELAELVVVEQSRKEEKRRRRRIRDGVATPKDLIQSQGRCQITSQASSVGTSEGGGWRLSSDEKRSRMERLVKWVIRGLSEEGVLVQVKIGSALEGPYTLAQRSTLPQSPLHFRSSRTSTTKETYAYLPLPEPLLLPLLIPHISTEAKHRSKIYIKKTDPRFGQGVLLDEIIDRLRAFGEEGRWERVGEWSCEDALVWGEGRGLVKRVGRGWMVV